MALQDLAMLPFVKIIDNAVFLSIYIQPNAKESAIIGLYDSKLKIKIAALAVDGKANKTLCAFIAKQFLVPQSHVTIIKGENTRIKIIKIVV